MYSTTKFPFPVDIRKLCEVIFHLLGMLLCINISRKNFSNFWNLGNNRQEASTVSDSELIDALQRLIHDYGYSEVQRGLRELKSSDLPRKNLRRSKKNEISSSSRATAKPKKHSSRITAPEYVAKAEISSERRPLVDELSRRFENKSFLPTFGDVRNFCQIYGIDEPATRSRASAIPRLFEFFSAMEVHEIRRILDDGMFSGPSRLGPIADAIRRSAVRRATAHPSDTETASTEVSGETRA